LNDGFYGHADEYDCEKKMAFYVLNYGKSYISEIYHYLKNSQILDNITGQFNILSLGCGFCPDYYAISKYITDHGINMKIDYVGIDISAAWNKTRMQHKNIHYFQMNLTDLSHPLSFQGYNLIMMNKVFSTIFVHNNHIPFLQNIVNAINVSMEKDAILIFNDVNSYYMGRDVFDGTISYYVSTIKKYYTDSPPFSGNGRWIQIPETDIIYPFNNYGDIYPLNTLAKSVFFEYRKQL
jgi:SAM-dependent methyltransferase